MTNRKKLYIVIAVLSLWLIFATGIAVGAFAISPGFASAPAAGAVDAESHYHRGLYYLPVGLARAATGLPASRS